MNTFAAVTIGAIAPVNTIASVKSKCSCGRMIGVRRSAVAPVREFVGHVERKNGLRCSGSGVVIPEDCHLLTAEGSILRRLDAGETYAEGTPLEAAILAHCRATGRDIEWNDGRGCVTCFGDVEGRAQ